MVLGGEDVATGPPDSGAQDDQGLDEDGGLHGHVQRPGDAGAGQGLLVGELGPEGHEARHLVLGQANLVAPEPVERQVGDPVVLGERRGGGHDDSSSHPGGVPSWFRTDRTGSRNRAGVV